MQRALTHWPSSAGEPLMLRRWAMAAGMMALLLSATWLGVLLLTDPKNTPVRDVKVEGSLQYSNRAEIQRRVSKQAVWGFYLLDLVALRDDLLSLPWIASAAVSRVWPDTLYLQVSEHKPMAIWNSQQLVAADYTVFTPPQLQTDYAERQAWLAHFETLPRLSGEAGRHAAVVELYREISRMLEPLGVAVVALTEDERRSISLRLDNEVSVRLGRKQALARMRRMVAVYAAAIGAEVKNVEQVDMRYPQGFAIQYRENAETASAGE